MNVVFEYWFRFDSGDFHITKELHYESTDADFSPDSDWVDDNLACIYHALCMRFGFSRVWTPLRHLTAIGVTCQDTSEVILYESGEAAQLYLDDILVQVFV